jgi:hypothetical protein
MRSELSRSEKPLEKNKKTSQKSSLTDWERIDNMRDEDIILDDEHPDADPAHMTHIKIWRNGKLLREID